MLKKYACSDLSENHDLHSCSKAIEENRKILVWPDNFYVLKLATCNNYQEKTTYFK